MPARGPGLGRGLASAPPGGSAATGAAVPPPLSTAWWPVLPKAELVFGQTDGHAFSGASPGLCFRAGARPHSDAGRGSPQFGARMPGPGRGRLRSSRSALLSLNLRPGPLHICTAVPRSTALSGEDGTRGLDERSHPQCPAGARSPLRSLSSRAEPSLSRPKAGSQLPVRACLYGFFPQRNVNQQKEHWPCL